MIEKWLDLWITPVHAADLTTTSQGAQSSGFSFVIMLVVFFLFVYFAIWRPQNKRAKEQQNLLSALTVGDEVVTTGGIIGRIMKINDQYVTLSVANNVDFILKKSSIANILPKGTLKAME